jgi:hypothetical protein
LTIYLVIAIWDESPISFSLCWRLSMSERPLTFPVSAGLLEPKHVKAMPAQTLFVYLWFVNRITKDSPNGDGKYSGAVLGGKPVKHSRISEELGINERSVRRYIGVLIREGYLQSTKTGSGACIYTVTKSKKYCWKRNKESEPKPAPIADSIDPRHVLARSLIQELFQSHFSVTCPWEGSEAKALSNLLKGNPSWTAAQIEQMIRHRFSSDGITGDRPRIWLPNLAKYSAAALDKYQKPKTSSARVPAGRGAENNWKKLLEASQ